MNTSDTAMPVFVQIEGTPQQIRELVAQAIHHDYNIKFTFHDSQEVVEGRITYLNPRIDNKDTKIHVTLTSGNRIIVYVPPHNELATVSAYVFPIGTTENSVNYDV